MYYCQSCGEDETCCKCSIISHPHPSFDCGSNRSKNNSYDDLLKEIKILKAENMKLKKELKKRK